MAETRAQALLKEAAVREAEEAFSSKFVNLEERMARFGEKLEEKIAAMFEAIKLIPNGMSNSIGGERSSVISAGNSSPHQHNLQDQTRISFSPSSQTTNLARNPGIPIPILDDPIAELQNLQETDGILEYHNKFEQIRNRVSLSEEYLVSAYLAGLRNDTQMNVRMFQPKSIRQCLMIGKLYESTLPKKVFSSGFRADLHSVAPKEDELMREESDFDQDSSRILGGNKGTEADSVVFQEQIKQEPENVLNSTGQTLGTLTNILRDCSHDQHPNHFSDGGHDNLEANSNNSTSWLSLQSDIESVSRLGAHSKGKICEKSDFQASEVIHKSLDTLAFEIASDVELEELDETVAVSIDKIELNLVTPEMNPIESFEIGGARKVLDKLSKANIVFLGSCFHLMKSKAPWFLTDVTNSLTLLSECAREVEWVDVHSSLVFDPGIDDLYWFIGWDFTDLALVPHEHGPKVGAMMSIDLHNWIFDPGMQSQEGIHVETSVILIFDPGGLNLLLHIMVESKDGILCEHFAVVVMFEGLTDRGLFWLICCCLLLIFCYWELGSSDEIGLLHQLINFHMFFLMCLLENLRPLLSADWLTDKAGQVLSYLRPTSGCGNESDQGSTFLGCFPLASGMADVACVQG